MVRAVASEPVETRERPTHVALDVRLTVGEADLLLYWVRRLEVLIDRRVMTPARDVDAEESLAVVRKVADRISGAWTE